MKRINWWPVPIMLAVIGIAVIPFVTYSGDPAVVPDVVPAPIRAPDMYLEVSAGEGIRQPGFLVQSDWLIDGQVVSEPIVFPVEWPFAVELSGSNTVTIKILSESMPATLEIRQFEQLNTDGTMTGEPVATASWLHPGLFQHNHNSVNPVALPKDSNGNAQGWGFDLPIAPSDNVSFITVWATWKGPYSANWNFAVKR